MKKIALTLLTLTGALALAGCGNKESGVSTQKKANFKDMAQTSALSSISMLNAPTTSRGLKRALSEDEQKFVLRQLDLVDELLKGDAVKSEEKNVVEGDKYHGVYDKFYTLSTTEINGTKSDYTFYYKETLEAPEAEEKPEEKAKEEKPAEEEQEVSSKLDGVVLLGDKEFKMHGDKEVTKEAQEIEVEFKFVITDEATGEKVIVKQETETGGGENENEYKYTKQDKDNKVLEEVKIDFETENNETEYSVSSLKNGVESINKFKFENDKVKVTIVENGKTIKATLKVVDNKYVFEE